MSVATAGSLVMMMYARVLKERAQGEGSRRGLKERGCRAELLVCVYYCRTYYNAVRVGGGGEWRTCAMRDDEPRPVLPLRYPSSS